MTVQQLIFSHISVTTAPIFNHEKPVQLEIGIHAAPPECPDDTAQVGIAQIIMINTATGILAVDAAIEDYFSVIQALQAVQTIGTPRLHGMMTSVGRSVAVILDFNIEEPHRGKRIGALTMHMILSLLTRFSVDDVILRPCAYEIKQDEFEAMNRRLMVFYARFGFLPTVGESRRREDMHMVKRLSGEPLSLLSRQDAELALQEWQLQRVLRAA